MHTRTHADTQTCTHAHKHGDHCTEFSFTCPLTSTSNRCQQMPPTITLKLLTHMNATLCIARYDYALCFWFSNIMAVLRVINHAHVTLNQVPTLTSETLAWSNVKKCNFQDVSLTFPRLVIRSSTVPDISRFSMLSRLVIAPHGICLTSLLFQSWFRFSQLLHTASSLQRGHPSCHSTNSQCQSNEGQGSHRLGKIKFPDFSR